MATPQSTNLEPMAGTISRAVALRFAANSLIQAGTGLDLLISPTASASQRNLRSLQPVDASATALGLGFGNSRFLADPGNNQFFNSPGLFLITGAGQINGQAKATASALGPSDVAADASAINIAIANTNLLSRSGDPLRIGSEQNPLLAMATAAGHALQAAEPALSGPDAAAVALQASARVRGLEGRPAAEISPAPSFQGQPIAMVEAVARLDPGSGSSLAAGSGALADAKGLEGYQVVALPGRVGAALVAQVGGVASARLELPPSSGSPGQPQALLGSAIGIDNSTILGPANGALVVVGKGMASLDTRLDNGADASLLALAPSAGGELPRADLQGLGIHGSTVMANGGDAQVIGLGGVASDLTLGSGSRADAAGIDASTVWTGAGNDWVEGRSLVAGSVDGIRNSSINTGSGNDQVRGTANTSQIDGGSGNDAIALEQAQDSSLAGGFGSDLISLGKGSQANQLQGGFGNDQLLSVAGTGNRLDGGFGQDQLWARDGGGETFVQSNAGAALRAADSRNFAERLTDPDFWAALNDTAKQDLWQSGSWMQGGKLAGQVDVMAGFDPGRGDKLEISSSLAGFTQDLWNNQGGIFGFDKGHLIRQPDSPGTPAGGQLSPIGLVVGTLAEIGSLGIGSPTIAYASDTHQLMFDADGDWSQGSISMGSVTMANPTALLQKADIRFNA
jgi:hypothetical protein